MALRQQYSLQSHVVPGNVTDKIPAHHGKMDQKLLSYSASYRCLAEEGRWLVFDQFLLRLEKHFETAVFDRHVKPLQFKFHHTCTAPVESDLYELLPLPLDFRKILTQPSDLQDEHTLLCLQQFLHQACSMHNIKIGSDLDGIGSWMDRL